MSTQGKICPFVNGECKLWFCAFWDGDKEGNCMIYKIAQRKLDVEEDTDEG